MDELIKQTSLLKGTTAPVSAIEALIAFFLVFFLAVVISYTYRRTHEGVSYNRALVFTMLITSVVVAAIMIIIGSNIARAFSLVGALSIIRYRTAVKDPKDVAYIFLAVAVGMACGTRFYLIGVLLTLFVCTMIFTLYKFQFAAGHKDEWILKILLPENLDYEKALDQPFRKHLSVQQLVRMDSVKMGTMVEFTFGVTIRPDTSKSQFISDLKEVNQNQRIQLLSTYEHIDA